MLKGGRKKKIAQVILTQILRTQLVRLLCNMSQRGENEEEKESERVRRTHTHTKCGTKQGNWQKKSVKPGINNPSPQMPSIVPCLDKVSKSGWKMQAPFLSVWNYYPFVLSQALLSSTSCACVDASACACVRACTQKSTVALR